MSNNKTVRKVLLTYTEDDENVEVSIKHVGFDSDDAVPLYIQGALEYIIESNENGSSSE